MTPSSHTVTGNYSTLNGRIIMTTNFFTHMNMGSYLHVVMGLRGDFIQEFLCIQQTTQRSTMLEMHQYICCWLIHLATRVLIVNVRNLSRCPCPQCLILKDQVQNVMTNSDMVQHQMLAHRDTVECCNKISSAHALIYKKWYVVNTVQVEAKLKDESLVPTVVSIISKIVLKYNSKDVLVRMCF